MQSKRRKEAALQAFHSRYDESKHQPHLYHILRDEILEIRFEADGTFQCLAGFKNMNIPPIWDKKEALPPGAIIDLLEKIEHEYKQFLRIRI